MRNRKPNQRTTTKNDLIHFEIIQPSSPSAASTIRTTGGDRRRTFFHLLRLVFATILIGAILSPRILSRKLVVGVSTAVRLFGRPSTSMMATSTAAAASKKEPQQYKLLRKTQLSPDSYLLRYQLPSEDAILGHDPAIPTCIKVDFTNGTNAKTGEYPHTLSKSYSPVSHPNTEGYFDLIVKSYPDQPGGGVGRYICNMEPGEMVTGTLKADRIMHGSPYVEGRWKHVGLVAGGTGIAPLLQLARILLESERDRETQVHLLFVNRHDHDILGKTEIDRMAQDEYPDRFHVFYALTNGTDNGEGSESYLSGRGDVEMARLALPPPSSSSSSSTADSDTMIFVCGKDGFVAHWGGPVTRAPPPPGAKKGPKIQGPLLGVLAEAGYTADQVFKY